MIPKQIEYTKIIFAPPDIVWDFLTKPGLMKQWMGEPEMNIEIITDWKVGNPIIIKGWHHVKFENKGTVLQFHPCRILKYDYLSSLSRLSDSPETHTTIKFILTQVKNETSLTLAISDFPTEEIFKHVDFYWRTTIEILKRSIETMATKD